MDKNELAKQAERCPWCGGRVMVTTTSEPGAMTLISCVGPTDASPCNWSISGDEADRVLQAASHHAA